MHVPSPRTGLHIDIGADLRDRTAAFQALGAHVVAVEGSEIEILAGLTQPLRVVSSEFAGEAIDAALACVDQLERPPAAVATDPRAWGDVYARFDPAARGR